jgi:hypothetical protein
MSFIKFLPCRFLNTSENLRSFGNFVSFAGVFIDAISELGHREGSFRNRTAAIVGAKSLNKKPFLATQGNLVPYCVKSTQ